MVLVVALLDLAESASRVLIGARYVTHIEGGGKELRHQVHLHQPDVLVIDYRVGGSTWRATDEIPAIVSRTESQPHVIAVLPSVSAEKEYSAADEGCYDVLSFRDPDFEQDLLEAVESALLDRERRGTAPRRLSRDGLH